MNKLKSIKEIGEFAESYRKQGFTIALSHGVFDLKHPGHTLHLQAAKRKANILIVSITANDFVKKGPGRPYFPEMIRANDIAALECVDYVVINYAETAVNLIDIIKPHFYVKGQDYENERDDITGKIVDEKLAVERNGGKLVFTNDIMFSSSGLINKYMNLHEPALKKILDQYRAENALEEMINLINKVKDYKVVLIGDTIIDEYHYVKPLGKPSKENILANLYEKKEVFAGGVIAAANHVASFCKEVEVITVLGQDGYEEFIRESVLSNVKLNIVYRPGAPTTRKLRYVDINYNRKLFEIYFDNQEPFEEYINWDINNKLEEAINNAKLMIITDFGHGVLSDAVILSYKLQDAPIFKAATAQINAGNQTNLITKYKSLTIDYICLDESEARFALRDRNNNLNEIAIELAIQTDCPKIIITCGKNGCIAYRNNIQPYIIPAFTGTIIDTMGAGDAFLAITALLIKAGGRIDHIGFIGNAVGAIKVGIVGHRKPVDKISLLKFLKSVLQ